ncbi:hypothetical protein AC579_2426 [Pseudocercospora musae]|uniref:BTB domain-containing protein n=1 Tax=Pseudocercospora musae TaxID=113226 RepID=A0A139IBR5_9PEZI|nr:hypothetical protein AC579_2426 [Pseudocercospora musae]
MSPSASFDRGEAEKDLLKILAESFDSPAHSPDITIKCNGKATLCYKHILCRRSDWFSKAITGGFLESGSSVIELKEECDDSAVRRMLEFCYSLDYSVPEECAPSIHARMVALADKYIINGLVAFATDRFRMAIETASCANLAAAAEEVYAERSSAVYDLHSIIIDNVLVNESYLGGPNADFDRLLYDIPQFAVDLSRAQYAHYKQGMRKTYVCPGSCNPKETFQAAIQYSDKYTFQCTGRRGHAWTYAGRIWHQQYLLKE